MAAAASTADDVEAVDEATAELAALPLDATEPAVAADEFEVERGELTPDYVTALEEDKGIVVAVDRVNLADDTVIDGVVAWYRENFVAADKANGEVGLVFSSGFGDTIIGEAPMGEAPIGEVEAEGGLLPATAPVVVPDPWDVPSFDLFEEFSFASCCFDSSSSDFFVFLGAPNALNHALKFGFSLDPEELELDAVTIFSVFVDLPPTSKVLAVNKASNGLCLSLASGVSSVCVSMRSSFPSKDVVEANIVALGKGSKPSKTVSFLFLSFSSTSLSTQVDKTGLTAALFTVLLANSSIKEDCPKPKLSVFITVPRLSLGTLSAVSTINEFLTSFTLAATGPNGNNSSGLLTFCIRLPLALPGGGGGCKSNCVSFGLGAVIVVNVGGTVVGGGINKGVFAAAAADDKEAIEGAFTEELFEEAFTVVLPTELPEVTE
uniref:Uncharacterized protein n=1 Tax=Glossina brevipalpis TaxID=37001 RepID=A0A1A9WU42_9MUSC